MVDDAGEARELPAGAFSAWVAGMQAAIRGGQGSDVPCAGCTACCTSSQFIHIGPDETDTLAHIPAALLFPAPRRPRGQVLMGYDERGHCPMLIDNACSIYEHRPQTCRTYDCRIFPAADVDVDDDAKSAIADRARQWRFSHPTPDDRTRHQAVRAAAAFVHQREAALPDAVVPANATQLAVLAIELHEAFLRHDPASGELTAIDPTPEAVRAELARRSATGNAT
jgi:uncharacterized protein